VLAAASVSACASKLGTLELIDKGICSLSVVCVYPQARHSRAFGLGNRYANTQEQGTLAPLAQGDAH
jgi:hypothetical protein